MRRRVLFFVSLFVLFLVETAFKNVFPGSHVIPQLALLFLLASAEEKGFRELLVASLFAGFLGELFSGVFFGTAMIIYLFGPLLARFLSRNTTTRALSLSNKWAIVIVVTAISPFVAYLINLVASSLGLAAAPIFAAYVVFGLLWQIGANLILYYPVRSLINLISRE